MSLTYEGRVYRFADAGMREAFRKQPERFQPANGGRCPVTLLDRGEIRPGEPRWSVRFRDQLFLCADEQGLGPVPGEPRPLRPRRRPARGATPGPRVAPALISDGPGRVTGMGTGGTLPVGRDHRWDWDRPCADCRATGPASRRGLARRRRTLVIEGLEARRPLSATPPAVVMDSVDDGRFAERHRRVRRQHTPRRHIRSSSASTARPTTVSTRAISRSATRRSCAPGAGAATLDLLGQPAAGPGHHRLTIPLPGGLPPDPERSVRPGGRRPDRRPRLGRPAPRRRRSARTSSAWSRTAGSRTSTGRTGRRGSW